MSDNYLPIKKEVPDKMIGKKKALPILKGKPPGKPDNEAMKGAVARRMKQRNKGEL